jgi:thiol-disulfide isomerase/thioredoxin
VRTFLAASVTAALIAGCGAQPRSVASGPQELRALRGSPPMLAALHAEANALLGGGVAAFRARMRSLHGYPVVVNLWASWCDSCQSEFPTYQRLAVDTGRRVAFIGVDAKDSSGSAAAFLKRFPVPYPSYVDPSAAITAFLGTVSEYPQTIFFNRAGKQTYDHAGPYVNVAVLARDINQYAQ